MQSPHAGGTVLVQVVPMDEGREISWGANVVTALSDRLQDIGEAIAAGTQATADSLSRLSAAPGWEVKEVSASFGVSVVAEAGVIVSKASAGSALEVTVTFRRDDARS